MHRRLLNLLTATAGVALLAAAILARALPGPWHSLVGFLLVAATLSLCYFIERPELERKKRRRRGLCVACGYDLTGNLSGTCPECGTLRA